MNIAVGSLMHETNTFTARTTPLADFSTAEDDVFQQAGWMAGPADLPSGPEDDLAIKTAAQEETSMFCSQCGQKAPEEAKFCTNCGQPFNRQSSQPLKSAMMQILCVPVYLNISLTKTEPHILRLDTQKCCLLKVGKELHARITAQAINEKGKAQAFIAFTRLLEEKPVTELLQDFPGSVDMPMAQIRQLAVLTYYDSDFHRHMAYDRFTLMTDTGKYRGSIDYDTDMAARRPVLQQLLGNRFTFKEVIHSFDD